jgi:hypothetical protein
MKMAFIEAKANFYLGREYDPTTNRLTNNVVYYDARDLTTHAVVVGMTGSGKTGLCITLLEEAILDNIPAIVIDPKGDITNLLLTFPDMRPEDFEPWVNVDDSRRANMDIPQYAADVAQKWKTGLENWGIVPDRVRWLQLASKYSIYTPGSDAGLPISILASLRAPREGWTVNEEAHREQIKGITSAILALAGINAEPVKDREHVLLSNIFENAWKQGKDLTLEDIILQIQKPPFDTLGVFPIEKYFPEKARTKLAMEMNNIIAAPSFQSWINGQSLDIHQLLYQPNGRPRTSIFYIAHLSEPERQFIVTLILENMLGWMRTQQGTTSLRAILYIDEMFGYFPPYPKNPPTKDPLMRLLKQARAFGLGLVLATQNPGDLDYKGLTNAGTWFIGRLQSDNDRKRVMDGLQAMANVNDSLSLRDIETLIADIAPRVFLMRNVHNEAGPMLVHSRWAMSYLRGPLTRQQIQLLMSRQREELMVTLQQQAMHAPKPTWQQQAGLQPPPPPPTLPTSMSAPVPPPLPNTRATHMPPPPPMTFTAQSAGVPPQTIPTQPPMPTSPVLSVPSGITGYSNNPPPLSSTISQYFLPVRIPYQASLQQWSQRTGIYSAGGSGVQAQLVYKPGLLAQAMIRYADRKANIYTARMFTYFVTDLQRMGIVHWEDFMIDPIEARTIEQNPQLPAAFGELSSGLADTARLNALKKEVVDMLYNTAQLIIPYNDVLNIYGNPDTDYSEFQAQVQIAAREQRDMAIDKLAQKYGDMMDRAEAKLRKTERDIRSEQTQLKGLQREQLFTTGEAITSLMRGRTNYTLSRMSRTSRYQRNTKDNIRERKEVMSDLERELDRIEMEFEEQVQKTNDYWANVINQTREYIVAPFKKDIQLELFGIGWLPAWYANLNGQIVFLQAY